MFSPVTFKNVKDNPMTDHIATRGAHKAGGARYQPSIMARIAGALAVPRRRTHVDMPAHLHNDVGLAEADILPGARRPVWDVPQSWRR